uniref:Uncharacterized protein n=1 Tax=Arundo donax TaxID=35708 RepID=A0A0A9H7D1_ARUDO
MFSKVEGNQQLQTLRPSVEIIVWPPLKQKDV